MNKPKTNKRAKQMYRYQVSLCRKTVKKAQRKGAGNLSNGLRICVEQAPE